MRPGLSRRIGSNAVFCRFGRRETRPGRPHHGWPPGAGLAYPPCGGRGAPRGRGAERSGRARITAWTAPQRLPHLPDHPVFAEAWPDIVALGWFGLHAPARTPAAAIRRLNAACAEALAADAPLRERLAAEGLMVPAIGPPETFAAFLDAEATRLAALLRRIDLRPAQ